MDDEILYTRLPESADYLAARGALRLAELEVTLQRERVAELRRQLPEGPIVEDYVMLEASIDGDSGRKVRLSELFSGAGRTLIVYQLMFGKRQTEPCPMCTMWVDGLNGIAEHVTQRADLAIVAAADVPALRAHARDRTWSRLRVLSAGSSTFKRDLGSEDEAGNQEPRISVFTKDASGQVRHFYSGSPQLSREMGERGIDLCCATWQLLDLTPEGRGDWYSSLRY